MRLRSSKSRELKISTLSIAELRSRLSGAGVSLRTGPFVIRVQSSIPSIARAMNLLYADYLLEHDHAFADFHARIVRPWGARRWFRPQVKFLFDGDSTFKPLPLDQAFPMLEWGLNWCVSSHAHSYLMIHAAVVERGGRAMILPAPPGSGKSTLCAAMVSRGWRLLSDEITLIRVDSGRISPLPRPISLKNESIQVIKRFQPDAVLSRPVHDTMKGTVAHMKAPADSVDRALECARPAWIVFPKYCAESAISLEEVPKSRAFMRVADNAFNYSLLGVKGFETMSGLVGGVQCFDLSYADLDAALAALNALAAQPEVP